VDLARVGNAHFEPVIYLAARSRVNPMYNYISLRVRYQSKVLRWKVAVLNMKHNDV